MKVVVVEHDQGWRATYGAEAKHLHRLLGSAVAAIHHIGSTAIAGICAKPIIDILMTTRDLDRFDAESAVLTGFGYEAMGEYGLPGRRYFRKNDAAGTRLFQIHTFVAHSPEAIRHLAFRDYLRSHPDAARAYSDLKRRLAARHHSDYPAYMDGKHAMIREIETAALGWYRGSTPLN